MSLNRFLTELPSCSTPKLRDEGARSFLEGFHIEYRETKDKIIQMIYKKRAKYRMNLMETFVGAKCLKRGRIALTKSRLELLWHLICRERGACFPDQSQTKIGETDAILDYL